MTERLDDLLRDSLREAASGVQAPEDGLRQLRHTLERRRRRQRGAILAVAAALIAGVAIASVGLLRGGDDDSPVIADEPTTTTQDPTITEPDAAATAVDPRNAMGPRPEQVVAATEDGRLVVLDVATGNEVRELARAGTATDYQDAGSEPFIDAVEVSPDGSMVYFSTCCEPASGAMFQVPLDGGAEPVRLALDGAYPTIRPDAGDQIVVTNNGIYAYELPVGTLETGSTGSSAWKLAEASGNGSHPFWLGATSLAFQRFDHTQGSSIVVISGIDSESPTVTDLPTESGIGWEHPVGTDAAIIVAEQCCAPEYESGATGRIIDPVSGDVLESFELDGPVADLDLSNNWLLITYTGGETAQVDLSADTLTPEPLASGINNAAWVPPPSTSLGTPTSLTDEQARTAEAEVRAFLDDLGRGDLDAAQDRLSNYLSYSAADLATDPILSILAQEEVVVTVTPSWSFTEPAPVVTASTDRDTGVGLVAAAFLVDPRQPLGFDGGSIHRVQTVEDTPEIDTTAAPGEQIVIPGVPVEGGARAFLGDVEVPIEVDYEALEMRVTYPPDTAARVLTISSATPELPTATAFPLDVTG
jgi:hypothetical protein